MNILIRATIKSRNRLVDYLPYLVTPPVVAGYYDINAGVSRGFYAPRGATISVTPGTWADVNDTPTVVGYWIDWNDVQVAANNVTTFTIPMDAPLDIGFGYYWKEVATQAGQSAIYYHEPYVQVAEDFAVPYFNGSNTTITGTSRVAGAVVTKPDIRWYSILGDVASRSGQWYKNGVATGVTTSTYSDTADGDILFWEETATDGAGGVSLPLSQSPYILNNSSYYYLISNKIVTLAAQSVTAIESRITGKTPEVAQHLFSNTTVDWSSTTFVPNTNLWCQDLRSQLTGFHMFLGGGWLQSYSMCMVTPRHIVSCAHNGPQPGVSIRFVSATGEVFETTLLKWCNDNGDSRANVPTQTLEADLSLYLLADAVPSWVYKAPVLGMTKLEHELYLSSGALGIAISQGGWAAGPANSNCPRNRKAYPKKLNGAQLPSLTFPFYHEVQVGDSGSAQFLLANGTLYFHGIITSGGGGYWTIADFIPYINNMIARSDAAAVTSGHLSAPTGHTVTVVPLSSITV